MLRNFEWKVPEESHAGDAWMDVDRVHRKRQPRNPWRQRRENRVRLVHAESRVHQQPLVGDFW